MDEIWKVIPGYPYYEISNLGNIRSWKGRGRNGGLLKTPRVKRAFVGGDGYLFVKLQQNGKRTNYRVHRLVLESFIGKRPNGMVARHLDGNRLNPSLDNLKWSTQKENMADMVQHGTRPMGETHHNSTISDYTVHNIRRLLDENKKRPCDIARLCGVRPQYVNKIKRGDIRNWTR